jgi:hypothetical protein
MLDEVTAFLLPSKGNRRRMPRTGLMIPPPDRCRSRQGLNLHLLPCDRRVFRSNRSLTASEEEIREKYRRSSPGALPVTRSRETQALFFAAQFAVGHGEMRQCRFWWRSIFTFTARKGIPRRRSPHRGRRWGRRRRSPKDRAPARQYRSGAGLARCARGFAPLLRSAVPLRFTNRRPRACHAK